MHCDNRPTIPWPENCATYRDALYHVLNAAPERVVVLDNGAPLTASDLLDRIAVMVAWLQQRLPSELETPARRPSALLFHDNVWAVAGTIACWFLRVPALLLDYRVSAADLRNWHDRHDPILIATQQKRLKDATPAVALLDDPGTLLSDPNFVAAGRQAMLDAAPAREDDVAEYLMSSGVTGPPRPHPVTHARLLAITVRSATEGQRGAWGTALSPISVAYGAARAVWWRNLLWGRTIHSMSLLFSIRELDHALRDERIEEATLPPHLIRALIRHAGQESGPQPRYPHLMKLQSVGGPAPPADKLDAQRVLSSRYVMTFSSTETGIVSRIEGDDVRMRPASCGRPLPGVQLEIVDDDGISLPTGAVGRIRVTLTKPDGSATHAFPGDLGWLDAEGFLFIAGRGDGIICRNGVNFSAAALEAKLMACPDVAAVAVLRVDRPEGDDGLVLAIAPDDSAERSTLARSLRHLLASHEQPEAIIEVDPEHLSVSGKIQRSAVLQQFLKDAQSFRRI